MRSLYTLRARECQSETVISLSESFPPAAAAVCLSAAVSPSGCFWREEGRKEVRREGGKEGSKDRGRRTRMSAHSLC